MVSRAQQIHQIHLARSSRTTDTEQYFSFVNSPRTAAVTDALRVRSDYMLNTHNASNIIENIITRPQTVRNFSQTCAHTHCQHARVHTFTLSPFLCFYISFFRARARALSLFLARSRALSLPCSLSLSLALSLSTLFSFSGPLLASVCACTGLLIFFLLESRALAHTKLSLLLYLDQDAWKQEDIYRQLSRQRGCQNCCHREPN